MVEPQGVSHLSLLTHSEERQNGRIKVIKKALWGLMGKYTRPSPPASERRRVAATERERGSTKASRPHVYPVPVGSGYQFEIGSLAEQADSEEHIIKLWT